MSGARRVWAAALCVLALLFEGALSGGRAVAEAAPGVEWQLERGDAVFDTEIIGGRPVATGEFPWMVRIEPDGCGGSLIKPDVVLTAAHCLDEIVDHISQYTATVGAVDLASPAARTITAEAMFRSPNVGIGHDWGLLKLSEPVLDLSLLPIATTDGHDTGNFQVMGWGAAPAGQGTLKKIFVSHVPDDVCKQTFNPRRDFRVILCAGTTAGAGVCSGDSGGPLIKRKPSGAMIQVGIVSFTSGACADGDPDGYMQVSFLAAEIAAAAEVLSDH